MKTLKTFSAAALLFTTGIININQSKAQTIQSVNEPAEFNRIAVKGNVEVTLIQRKKFGLAYSDENTGEVKVVQQGHALSIRSSSLEPAKLIVYVDETFFRVSAVENAQIHTRGQLKVSYLQIILKDQASAEINSETKGLYTLIDDKSKLKLRGSTDDHNLLTSKTSKLIASGFTALNIKTLPISENTLAASGN